jgi:hypothetical protein
MQTVNSDGLLGRVKHRRTAQIDIATECKPAKRIPDGIGAKAGRDHHLLTADNICSRLILTIIPPARGGFLASEASANPDA